MDQHKRSQRRQQELQDADSAFALALQQDQELQNANDAVVLAFHDHGHLAAVAAAAAALAVEGTVVTDPHDNKVVLSASFDSDSNSLFSYIYDDNDDNDSANDDDNGDEKLPLAKATIQEDNNNNNNNERQTKNNQDNKDSDSNDDDSSISYIYSENDDENNDDWDHANHDDDKTILPAILTQTKKNNNDKENKNNDMVVVDNEREQELWQSEQKRQTAQTMQSTVLGRAWEFVDAVDALHNSLQASLISGSLLLLQDEDNKKNKSNIHNDTAANQPGEANFTTTTTTTLPNPKTITAAAQISVIPPGDLLFVTARMLFEQEQYRIEEEEESSSTGGAAAVDPNTTTTTAPPAADTPAAAVSAAASRTKVDLGYHYTRPENMERIKTDGLLTKADREAQNIQAHYNGSFFGDGVYTAKSPFFGKHYGTVGLLVARLHGTLGPAVAGSTFPAPQNTGILNPGSTESEVVILRSSRQCVPIVQFDASMIPASANQKDTSHGYRVLELYQEGLQKLVDQFFAAGEAASQLDDDDDVALQCVDTTASQSPKCVHPASKDDRPVHHQGASRPRLGPPSPQPHIPLPTTATTNFPQGSSQPILTNFPQIQLQPLVVPTVQVQTQPLASATLAQLPTQPVSQNLSQRWNQLTATRKSNP